MMVSMFVWLMLAASFAAWRVSQQAAADALATERGEVIPADRAGDPGTAFVLCLFVPIALPFVLARGRGARGFLEGLCVVLIVLVLHFLSTAVLLLTEPR